MFFYTKYMNVPERDLDLPDLLFDLAVAFEDSLSTSDTVADEPLSGETRPTIQCSCECSLLASHRDPFTFRDTHTLTVEILAIYLWLNEWAYAISQLAP